MANNPNNRYELIVGNVGKVHEGTNLKIALLMFSEYKRLSRANEGRAAGESVTLMRNDQIVREYEGTINAQL